VLLPLAPAASIPANSATDIHLTTSTEKTTSTTVPAKTVVEIPPELDTETRLRREEKKQVLCIGVLDVNHCTLFVD
jgi:hypothetical protein